MDKTSIQKRKQDKKGSKGMRSPTKGKQEEEKENKREKKKDEKKRTRNLDTVLPEILFFLFSVVLQSPFRF